MALKDEAYALFVNTMEGTRDRQRAVSAVVDLTRDETTRTLAMALKKFAPDLAVELAERHREADGALDALLAVLRA